MTVQTTYTFKDLHWILFYVPTWRFPARQVSWHKWVFIINCQVILLMYRKLKFSFVFCEIKANSWQFLCMKWELFIILVITLLWEDCVCVSHLVLATPWTVAHQASLGKNTGVVCHVLLQGQGVFLTQGSSLGFWHRRQILYHWSYAPCEGGKLGPIWKL